MVNSVNPPPHVRIPQKYNADREVAYYHQQIGRILFQLWTRVGGGENDAIDDILNRTTTAFAIEPERPYAHTISGDYTTIGNELLKVTAACTVSLNASPDDQESVTLYNTGVRIIFDGNGKNVGGEDKIITVRKGTVLTVRYHVDLDEWVLE